jgi:hypothetical protein
MELNLKIGYEVNAEPAEGETEVDEQRLMAAIREQVDPFVKGIVDAAAAQGLKVTMSEDNRQLAA